MNGLPIDVIILILELLPNYELAQIARVSKRFALAFKSETLWILKLKHKPSPDCSALNCYKMYVIPNHPNTFRVYLLDNARTFGTMPMIKIKLDIPERETIKRFANYASHKLKYISGFRSIEWDEPICDKWLLGQTACEMIGKLSHSVNGVTVTNRLVMHYSLNVINRMCLRFLTIDMPWNKFDSSTLGEVITLVFEAL